MGAIYPKWGMNLAGLIVIVPMGSYKSDIDRGSNGMKATLTSIATAILLLTSLNYSNVQAGFVHENLLLNANDNSSDTTAYNIDSEFDLNELLFGFIDGTPFIQDSFGDNISSSPHVQIVSDEGGYNNIPPGRLATKDYFSFTGNSGDFLTLDVDCGYVTVAAPCNGVISSNLSQAQIIINLWDPDGNIAATTDHSSVDLDDDYGSSSANDPFLEYSLVMSGLWQIEVGQIFGGSNVNPFFTTEGYMLNVTLMSVSAVPVPAAVWLFGTALIGLIGVGRRKVQA